MLRFLVNLEGEEWCQVSDDVLPSDGEELGDLLVSGEMTSQQIDEFIDTHGHYVAGCDGICQEIIEAFDEYPLVLLLANNLQHLTTEQCLLVREKLEDHVAPEDQGTRANIASEKIELSVSRGLLAYVASDLKHWLDEEFLDPTFSDDEILVSVRRHLQTLAEFAECNEDALENFVSSYHYPGNWRSGGQNCDGELAQCETCQELLRQVTAKPKE